MSHEKRVRRSRRWLPWAAAGTALVVGGAIRGVIAGATASSGSSVAPASSSASSAVSSGPVTPVADQVAPSVVTSAASRPRPSLRWTIAGVIAVLAAVNVIDNRVAHASLVAGPVGAAGLLLAARRAGLSWRELGLGAGTWRRGLAWALAAIGAVAVVFTIGAALPLARGAFRDSRYQLSLGHALLTAFVLIPLGTVLFEEVAFRGVLWGLLRRARGTWTATIVSSALFGLWHVLPSLGLTRDNKAVGSAFGPGTSGAALSVLGTVLFTGLSGVLFCELRRRSGSLLAPAGLHWATNGLAVLAAAAVWARSPR